MGDVMTIIWKEIKEQGFRGGRRGKAGLIIFFGIFGVLFPLQWGTGWVTGLSGIILISWMPLLYASGVLADAVAGERERHTLDTLLATRLPGTAILGGKMAAGVIIACMYSWIIAVSGLIVTNIAFWNGKILMYPPAVLAAIILFPVLTAGFSGGITVHFSIRAETARDAQQFVSIGIIVLFLPFLIFNFLNNRSQEQIITFLSGISWETVPVIAALILLVLDLLLFFTAAGRFTRENLSLE
jgi:ABC-2 type transport system permease protein